jgi:mRNA interferase RelE/StbE
MSWTVSIRPKAEKDLLRLDRKILGHVLDKLSWMEKNFNSVTPQRLQGSLSDYYKIRVGDYRVIYDFDIKRFLIRVYRVEHRSKVYER